MQSDRELLFNYYCRILQKGGFLGALLPAVLGVLSSLLLK